MRSAKVVSTIACCRWVRSASTVEECGVGEERVITPHREQRVVRVFVLHPAHDEPCGGLVPGLPAKAV
jgi:hypothetical protein